MIFFLFIVGCEQKKNPITINTDFDSRLIGAWFYTLPLSFDYPAPLQAFYGMQITRDKVIKKLGIEIRTGKVAVLNESNYGEIIKAENNILIARMHYLFGTLIDSMYYEVGPDKLLISKNFYDVTFKKTILGRQVAEPIDFYFKTSIDSVYYESVDVYFYPPCFASKTSENDLIINAIMPGSKIQIEINNFKGVGDYTIPFAKAMLSFDHGDHETTYLSDSTITGTISITEYNDVKKICSGNFSFDGIRLEYLSNAQVIVRSKLRGGSFSLPLFK